MKWAIAALQLAAIALFPYPAPVRGGASSDRTLKIEFRTSDRCVPCHNQLKTRSGEDVSIGFQWRSSIMANSSRDPYWQGSVRRELIDHPESKADIEDECSDPAFHCEIRWTQSGDLFAPASIEAR